MRRAGLLVGAALLLGVTRVGAPGQAELPPVCLRGRGGWWHGRWETAGCAGPGGHAPHASQSWGGDWSNSYSGMGSGAARSKDGD
jgi:hypothetical protein